MVVNIDIYVRECIYHPGSSSYIHSRIVFATFFMFVMFFYACDIAFRWRLMVLAISEVKRHVIRRTYIRGRHHKQIV